MALQDLGRRDGDGLDAWLDAEKFFFTVWDDTVAEQINQAMGKRVSLHYEEKVGIPTRCFGETRYYVTRVTEVQGFCWSGITIPVPDRSPKP